MMKHVILALLILTSCGTTWPGGMASPKTLQLEPWRVCCFPMTLVPHGPDTTDSHMEAAWWAAAIWEKATGWDGMFSREPRGCPVDITVASMAGWAGYAAVTHLGGCMLSTYIIVDAMTAKNATIPYLTTIYVHEIGHVLGLSDHQDTGGVMYWRVRGNVHPRVPTDYEVDAVRAIYNLPHGREGPEVRDKTGDNIGGIL